MVQLELAGKKRGLRPSFLFKMPNKKDLTKSKKCDIIAARLKRASAGIFIIYPVRQFVKRKIEKISTKILSQICAIYPLDVLFYLCYTIITKNKGDNKNEKVLFLL